MTDLYWCKLKKIKKPLQSQELEKLIEVRPEELFAVLEISKKIAKGPLGFWGLNNWPEINPRGIRDRVYLIMQQESRPLHFREVASLIDKSGLFNLSKKTYNHIKVSN